MMVAALREQGRRVHTTDGWHFCCPCKEHFPDSRQTWGCSLVFLFHDFSCRVSLLPKSLPSWCCLLSSHTLFLPQESLSLHHQFTNLCLSPFTAPVLMFLSNIRAALLTNFAVLCAINEHPALLPWSEIFPSAAWHSPFTFHRMNARNT